MRDEHMVVREARYLSGNDIGKTVHLPNGSFGELYSFGADKNQVSVTIEHQDEYLRSVIISRFEPIKIEGKKSNAEEPTE